MSELKPCPFCPNGHVDFLDRMPRVGRLNEDARCSNCGARLPIAAWNNRPIEDALQAKIATLEKEDDERRRELTAQAAEYENRLVEERRYTRQAVDRIADLEGQLTAALERGKKLEEALREIVRMSEPDRVCANCAYCVGASSDEYCSLARHCKKLEDASSQTCEHFAVSGYIVPGTCEIAKKAISSIQTTAPDRCETCDGHPAACKGCGEAER